MNLSHPARQHISPFQASSTISGMSKSPQNYVCPPAKADKDSSQTPVPSVSFSSSSSSLNFLQPQNHYISLANTDFSDDYFHSQNNEDSARDSDIIISDEDDSNSIIVLDSCNKKSPTFLHLNNTKNIRQMKPILLLTKFCLRQMLTRIMELAVQVM